MIPINEKEHNTRIGKAIREFRLNYKNPDKPKTKGMTQTELANRISVTFQQVQKYEKGSNGTSSFRLLLISEALSVRISDIFVKAYHDVPEILTSVYLCLLSLIYANISGKSKYASANKSINLILSAFVIWNSL